MRKLEYMINIHICQSVLLSYSLPDVTYSATYKDKDVLVLWDAVQGP
jgi:hypothetical protein